MTHTCSATEVWVLAPLELKLQGAVSSDGHDLPSQTVFCELPWCHTLAQGSFPGRWTACLLPASRGAKESSTGRPHLASAHVISPGRTTYKPGNTVTQQAASHGEEGSARSTLTAQLPPHTQRRYGSNPDSVCTHGDVCVGPF